MARKRNEGFSLMELGIVLSLIVVMVGLLAPALGEVLREGRQQSAAQSVFRLSRSPRWAAIADGVAHLLHVQANNVIGNLEVYRGMGPKCDQFDWPTAMAFGPETGRSFDFATVNNVGTTLTSSDDHVISLVLDDQTGTAVNELIACYQPNGVVFTQVVGSGQPPAAQTVEFRLTIQRKQGIGETSAKGTSRRVVLPVHGTPWVN